MADYEIVQKGEDAADPESFCIMPKREEKKPKPDKSDKK